MMTKKPRFQMFPEGYSVGKLGSQAPNTETGDFDVVRNSTATRVNKDGLIEVMGANVPRLDYSDGGCPKLLTEQSGTNLVTYSEDFSQWLGTPTFVSLNDSISPSGEYNACRLTMGANQFFYCPNPAPSGEVVTSSIYINGVQGETITLEAGGFYITHTLSGGWERIISTGTSVGTSISLNTYGGVTARNFLVWGGQMELGSTPTSYIPTNGGIGTRQADQVTNAGDSSTFNSQSGVLFADFKENSVQTDNSGQSIFSITGVGGVNIGTTTNSRIRAYIYSSDDFQLDFKIPYNTLLQNKMALIYQNGNSSLYINGLLIQTESSVDLSQLVLNELNLDNSAGSFRVRGKTKSIQHYDYLSDEEMESLTGYDSYSAMTEQFNFNVL